MKPFILGIAGGTGSGKTTISTRIKDHFDHQANYIPHDRYYKSQAEKSIAEREKTNYDHPDSLETDLFITQLNQLINGQIIQVPIYDFTIHSRDPKNTTKVSPTPIIILEGILLFHEQKLRNLIDLKVYVDVPADIRILRRTKRDIEERSRTLDFCYQQYVTFTRPMHEQFVEPTKEFADIIIPQGGKNEKAAATLIHTIEKRMQRH